MVKSAPENLQRVNILRQLLTEGEISTQEELVDELRRQGFDVTQRTISRDLRRLGAVKAVDAGRTVYRLPDAIPLRTGVQSTDLKSHLVDIEHNNSLIVIHTSPGSASLIARHLDHIKPAGILGTIAGFQKIPEKYRNPIGPVADAKFSFTEYSFNTIVSSTERRALAVIERAGGKIDDEEVLIPVQAAEPPPLELSGYGRPAQLISHEDAAWKWQEGWAEEKNVAERDQRSSRVARHGGAVATLEFTGTGVGLVGELTGDGGRADVFLDGVESELVADAYIGPNTHDDDLWRITGLAPGKHTLRVVTQGKADPRSSGQAVRIGYAITFQ